MSTIDSENDSKPAPEAAQPKAGRKPDMKAKPAKKAGRAKKPLGSEPGKGKVMLPLPSEFAV